MEKINDDYVMNQIKFTESILEEWRNHPDRESFHIKRLRKVTDYIRHLVKGRKKKEVRILDVGCRNGQLLDSLRHFGFQTLYGVDICEEAIDYVQTKGHIGVERDCHVPLDIDEEFFDVIVLVHILEHCFDPELVLSNLKPLLKKNGFVIVEVPIQEKQEVPTKFMHYHIFDSAPYLHGMMRKCGFAFVEDKPDSWGYGALYKKVGS